MSITNQSPTIDPALWLEQHGNYLYRFALTRLHDEMAAEDAVQETLLAALKSRNNFAGLSAERTWLAGILKHKIIDYFRRACRETSFDNLCAAENWEEEFFDETGHFRANLSPNEWNSDAAEIFEQKEFQEVLRQSLSALPARLACVFTLREIDGLSNDEICRLLDISPNNLWIMLHRARLQLRRSLEENWFKAQSNTTVDSLYNSEKQKWQFDERVSQSA